MFSVFVYRIVCCACLCVCVSRHLWWNPTKYEQNQRKRDQDERERELASEMSQFGRWNRIDGWVKKPPVKPRTWHYITLSYCVVYTFRCVFHVLNKQIHRIYWNQLPSLSLRLPISIHYDYSIIDFIRTEEFWFFSRKKDRHTIQCYVTSMIAHEKRIRNAEKSPPLFTYIERIYCVLMEIH